VLVLGGGLFMVGAASAPVGGFSADVEVHLRFVAEHRPRWLWNAAGQGLGCLVALFGYVLLSGLLRDLGDRVLSRLALAGMGIGSVLFVLSMAFRFTVSDVSAQSFAATGVVPVGYVALQRWSSALFVLYMELAYLALAAYGAALLAAAGIPRWAGWTSLISGAGSAVLFLVPPAQPVVGFPFIPHLVPIAIGVALLRSASSSPPPGGCWCGAWGRGLPSAAPGEAQP
jgi:hypothetical protein